MKCLECNQIFFTKQEELNHICDVVEESMKRPRKTLLRELDFVLHEATGDTKRAADHLVQGLLKLLYPEWHADMLKAIEAQEKFEKIKGPVQ